MFFNVVPLTLLKTVAVFLKTVIAFFVKYVSKKVFCKKNENAAHVAKMVKDND